MLHAAGTRLRAAALLLLACCANAGTLFLIKVHAPTEAMLARVCEAARQSREAAFPSTFVLLDFTEPTGSSLLPPVSSWCEEEVSVTRLTLALMAELWGKKHAETFLEHGYHFASLPELTYHAKYGRKGGHKHVWVFEQDVAWTGNVFDFFPSYAILPQDFLCDKLRRMEMPAEQWAKQDGDGAPSPPFRHRSRSLLTPPALQAPTGSRPGTGPFPGGIHTAAGPTPRPIAPCAACTSPGTARG